MDNNSSMRDFFDHLAPTWKQDSDEAPIREKLTGMMRLPPDAVIADIGSGTGVMLPLLLGLRPRRILAIDLSGEMLRISRQNNNDPRIEFRQEDLLQAGLPLLDAAVLFNGYPHFLDKNALCEKIAACVCPGGVFCIMHSRSRAIINGRHGGKASALSVPLEAAEREAAKFSASFTVDFLEETDSYYFIRLLRKA